MLFNNIFLQYVSYMMTNKVTASKHIFTFDSELHVMVLRVLLVIIKC